MKCTLAAEPKPILPSRCRRPAMLFCHLLYNAVRKVPTIARECKGTRMELTPQKPRSLESVSQFGDEITFPPVKAKL
ncbi:hypothetical protein J6590_049849 [Homalodisca vitripennis]|nr:hypothetical protein J6590_049849 [Homalodisca vitripennis]